MVRYYLFIITFCLFFSFSSCSHRSSDETKFKPIIENSESFALELPTPVIPDSIKEIEAKRIYAGLHFWDDLDFKDTLRSLNDDFMEQNFSNFTVYLNAQPNQTAKMDAFRVLLNKAKIEPKALEKIKYIIKLYLAEPNSPMRSEDLWIAYLNVVTRDTAFSKGAELNRYEYELEMAMKNRPGVSAANFKYKSINGEINSLQSTLTGEKGLILIFYDPDCNSCQETLKILQENEELKNLVKKGIYTILAIDISDEPENWEISAGKLPEDWIVGFDITGIEENEIYYFPAMPSLYLLDYNYKVIRKDLDLNQLLSI